MIFSHSRLFPFAACCGILNAAVVVERGTCNADNCQRALNGYPSAAAFCASYTTARSTATTGLPTFATQCNGPTVSRLSSACSCYSATASPPTTTGATVTVTATQTQAASTVTATATQTLPPNTVTLPPDTVTLPPNTVTLPPDTVTLPPSTVTLPAATVTLPASTITAPGTAFTPPPGYSLGFGFDPVINSESYNVISFAAVQDPANTYEGQSYLLAKFDDTPNGGRVIPQVTVKVQPNTLYVVDGYYKKGLDSGTCQVAITVANQAKSTYIFRGRFHSLTTTYSYDSVIFDTGANSEVSVRYISDCSSIPGHSIYYDNLSLHPA